MVSLLSGGHVSRLSEKNVTDKCLLMRRLKQAKRIKGRENNDYSKKAMEGKLKSMRQEILLKGYGTRVKLGRKIGLP